MAIVFFQLFAAAYAFYPDYRGYVDELTKDVPMFEIAVMLAKKLVHLLFVVIEIGQNSLNCLHVFQWQHENDQQKESGNALQVYETERKSSLCGTRKKN